MNTKSGIAPLGLTLTPASRAASGAAVAARLAVAGPLAAPRRRCQALTGSGLGLRVNPG